MPEDAARVDVGHHCRVTSVESVVGPSTLVKKQIPIDPTDAARIQVTNDIMSIALTKGPITVLKTCPQLEPVLLICSFRGQQQGVRVQLVQLPDVVEAVTRIPVEGHTIG